MPAQIKAGLDFFLLLVSIALWIGVAQGEENSATFHCVSSLSLYFSLLSLTAHYERYLW
jgi:hypothetical protein